MKKNQDRICVGITGASGSIYAERLIEVLLEAGIPRIYLVCTSAAEQVVRYELKKKETGFSLVSALGGKMTDAQKAVVRVVPINDYFSPIASGSSAATSMVVTPCSMGTLARIAGGMSSTLLERAADVMLKEGRPLVICPRESPLGKLHLENMLRIVDLGGRIIPPMPAFYNHPKSIEDMVDFVVGRLLEAVGVEHSLYPPWNERML